MIKRISHPVMRSDRDKNIFYCAGSISINCPLIKKTFPYIGEGQTRDEAIRARRELSRDIIKRLAKEIRDHVQFSKELDDAYMNGGVW